MQNYLHITQYADGWQMCTCIKKHIQALNKNEQMTTFKFKYYDMNDKQTYTHLNTSRWTLMWA